MNCIIAGASGLVGEELLGKLIGDPRFSHVTAIGRSPLKTSHPKLKSLTLSFDQIGNYSLPKSEIGFCCLGTTIRKAQSREAFYKVDHDYILNFANACFTVGIKSFIVVSALGADAQSRVFYNKVKGKIENDLTKIGFDNLIILRPSLLLGARRESRPVEKVATILGTLISPLLVGPFRKVRPIEAKRVAIKMVQSAWESREQKIGHKIFLNHEI